MKKQHPENYICLDKKENLEHDFFKAFPDL